MGSWIFKGCIAEVIPRTIKILKILLPKILPIAISAWPRLAAIIDETISGRLVPIATMVIPINHSLIPTILAIETPPDTRNFAPPTKPINPAKTNINF